MPVFFPPKANHDSIVKSIMKSPPGQNSLVPMSFYKAAQGKQLGCLQTVILPHILKLTEIYITSYAERLLLVSKGRQFGRIWKHCMHFVWTLVRYSASKERRASRNTFRPFFFFPPFFHLFFLLILPVRLSAAICICKHIL